MIKLVSELENVILDQIEKLNQDDVMAKPKEAELLISRSKVISDLSNNFIEIQKPKLDAQRIKIEAVKVAQDAKGLGYENYLGIEDGDINNYSPDNIERVPLKIFSIFAHLGGTIKGQPELTRLRIAQAKLKHEILNKKENR